jgi:hypothetical protein
VDARGPSPNLNASLPFTGGNTLKLRETPKASGYQVVRRKAAMARLITSGTVITPGDATMGDPLPSSCSQCLVWREVQRLEGRGFDLEGSFCRPSYEI